MFEKVKECAKDFSEYKRLSELEHRSKEQIIER